MKVNKQVLKDYVLFSYVALTVLGLYSAAMFYMGTQYASAQNAPIVVHAANLPKK